MAITATRSKRKMRTKMKSTSAGSWMMAFLLLVGTCRFGDRHRHANTVTTFAFAFAFSVPANVPWLHSWNVACSGALLTKTTTNTVRQLPRQRPFRAAIHHHSDRSSSRTVTALHESRSSSAEAPNQNKNHVQSHNQQRHDQTEIVNNRAPVSRTSRSTSTFSDDDHWQSLTVVQLQQQLRLRGLAVSGRKQQLIDRLVQQDQEHELQLQKQKQQQKQKQKQQPSRHLDDPIINNVNNTHSETAQSAIPQDVSPKLMANHGQEFIDVSAYVDDADKGKAIKSSYPLSSHDDNDAQENVGRTALNGDNHDADGDDLNTDTSTSRSTIITNEVWGDDARMVDDYEGRSLVVDAMVRSRVEFTGSNRTTVQAYVVASRDALKSFLSGTGNQNYHIQTATAAEQRLYELQLRREQASAQQRPITSDDQIGLDEGDEIGLYRQVLHREVSDWGKYTVTGAQISAQEVQGVLLLSDVYGPFTEDNMALAEKIAFECQPVVVMAPDLFQGQPWNGPTTHGRNNAEQDYETWRRTIHSDLRVSVNIRASAACLRQRYGVNSIVVWGICYGGGRALETAAGWLPNNNNIHDVNGMVGPPLVNPMAAIAWYPTRYNARDLFGPQREQQQRQDAPAAVVMNGSKKERKGKSDASLAIMAVFAGDDKLDGATPQDASELKQLLQHDDRIKDLLVKVFPGQDHGFAHQGLHRQQQQSLLESNPEDRFVDEEFGGAGRLLMGEGDSAVAFLLSTAFMETYSRVFLPTVGPPISLDAQEREWNQDISMPNVTQRVQSRDVRKEIDDAIRNFREEPLSGGGGGGYRIDPTDESQEEELANLLRKMQDPDMEDGPFKIQPDDDLPTIYAKLTSHDENFQIF